MTDELYETIECPNPECKAPIKESDLENLKIYECKNCSMVFDVGDGDEDETEEAEPNQPESEEPDEDEPEPDEEQQAVDDSEKGEDDDKADEADSADDDSADDDSTDDAADDDSDTETEPEEIEPVKKPRKKRFKKKKKKGMTPKKRSKKKRKRKVILHKNSVSDYIEFFLDNPDGVTVDMIAHKFDINTQAAHYAQRMSFKYAETKNYEIEVKPINGTTKKLFFVRDSA